MRAKRFPILKGASVILQLNRDASIFKRSIKPRTIKINAKAGVGGIGEKFFCTISEPSAARRRGYVVAVG